MTVMSASSAARARMRSRCHARTPDTRKGAHHGIGAAAAKGRGARATGTVTGMRASLYSAEPQDYKSVTMLPAALLTQLRTAVGSDGGAELREERSREHRDRLVVLRLCAVQAGAHARNGSSCACSAPLRRRGSDTVVSAFACVRGARVAS